MKRRWITVAALMAVLALAYGPGLVEHVRLSFGPRYFNDDERIHTWPLLRYRDPNLFPKDVIADSILAMEPVGYRALGAALLPWLNVRAATATTAAVLMALFLAGIGAASWRLRGPVAAAATLALGLSGFLYLDRIAGALPRGFAFPLVALGAAALVAGRPLALAALCVAAAAFYPSASALLGFTLAGLLFLPTAARGRAREWSWRRRWAVLALTALLAGAAAAPAIVRTRDLGPMIRPQDWSAFPEAGPGGRYEEEDLPIDTGLFATARWWTAAGFIGGDRPWSVQLHGWAHDHAELVLMPIALILIVGGLRDALGTPGARRLAVLPLAALVGYELSLWTYPYLFLPQRYVVFGMATWALVALPSAVVTIADWAQRQTLRPMISSTAIVVVCGALLLTIGARGGGRVGLTVELPEDDRLYRTLAALPTNALVAGWPEGVIDNVPYVCNRSVLLSRETHQAFFKGYALEMRRRMNALIDAYFDSQTSGLHHLRDTFGVTHLIVDRENFRTPPGYFKPFDEHINAVFGALNGREPATLRHQEAAVYDDGRYLILDLARLSSQSP